MYRKIFISVFYVSVTLLCSQGFSQSTTPTTLLDPQQRFLQEQQQNSQLSQGHMSETGGDSTNGPSTNDALGHSGTNSTYDPENLTDSEKQLSENYIHQGLIEEKMNEACSGKMKAACNGQEMDHKFMGIDGNMVKALAKAYTMVIGTGVAGGDFTKRDKSIFSKDNKSENLNGSADKTEQAANNQETKKDNKQTDYCKYVAVGTEAVAMFQQTKGQDNLSNLPTNQDTAQKDMLYRAARSHGERAKNAKIQRNGWGITAACYTGMLTVAKLDLNLGLKLASSYLLTSFFQSEVANHEKYRKKVIDIANKLPGRGDCNPVTERDCYCAQPSTENDPSYCIPYLHKKLIAENSIRTTCVTTNLKADPSCSCRTTNTCYDQEFLNLAGPGFSNVNSNGNTRAFVKLTRGELVGADGSLGALNSQGAIRSALRKIDEQAKPMGLTNNQKEIARKIAQMGVPAKLAALLAKSPTSAKGEAFAKGVNATSTFTPSQYVRAKKSNGTQILSFSGGDSLKSRSGRKPGSSHNNRRKNKKSNSPNVLHYAEKAAAQAQIVKSKERALFEIISTRYQLSAPKRLELE